MDKTNQFKLINQDLWVSIIYLFKKGIPPKTIDSGISNYKKGKGIRWQCLDIPGESNPFIRYSTIPLNTMNRYDLPSESSIPIENIPVFDLSENQTKYSNNEILIQYRITVNNKWRRYYPFYIDLPINDKYKVRLSKTDAIISLIIELSREGVELKRLFESYQTIQFEYNLTFKSRSYSYFCDAINKFKENKIHEILPHGLIGCSSNNLKLTEIWQKKILSLYSKMNNPSKVSVHKKINADRLEKGLDSVSYATVSQFLSKPVIQNSSLLKRKGDKYFNNIVNPYISRYVNKVSSVWEIDATKTPFLVKRKGGKITRMTLMIVIDTYSNRIIGYSIGFAENADLVKRALFMAFSKTGHLPKQLVHDNGTAFISKELSTIKDYMDYWGTKWISGKVGNPKNKSRVERTFGTLNTVVFKEIEGYLGEGIQSTRKDAHPSEELMVEYWKKKNIRTEEALKKTISKSVLEFNRTIFKWSLSPNQIFVKGLSHKDKDYIQIKEEHIAIMFFNVTHFKIKQSTIVIQFEKQNYKYVIPYEYRLSLNGTRVKIYFNPNNLSSIYLFDSKFENKFICKVNEDYNVPLLRENSSEKDKEHVSKRLQENEDLKISILKNLEEIEQETRFSIPPTAIVPTIHDKELLNDIELQSMAEINYIKIENLEDDYEYKSDSFDINRIVVGSTLNI